MAGSSIRLPRQIPYCLAAEILLLGRHITAQEALDWGLVNRLVEPGQALETALKLARDLSKFPQQCMRNDRMSSYRQWNLDLEPALEAETHIGLETIASGETLKGAQQFAKGAGRHGKFS